MVGWGAWRWSLQSAGSARRAASRRPADRAAAAGPCGPACWHQRLAEGGSDHGHGRGDVPRPRRPRRPLPPRPGALAGRRPGDHRGSPGWLDDPGLFDLPYDPSAVTVSFPQAASVAAGWGKHITPRRPRASRRTCGGCRRTGPTCRPPSCAAGASTSPGDGAARRGAFADCARSRRRSPLHPPPRQRTGPRAARGSGRRRHAPAANGRGPVAGVTRGRGSRGAERRRDAGPRRRPRLHPVRAHHHLGRPRRSERGRRAVACCPRRRSLLAAGRGARRTVPARSRGRKHRGSASTWRARSAGIAAPEPTRTSASPSAS